jgi:hypothetical protein
MAPRYSSKVTQQALDGSALFCVFKPGLPFELQEKSAQKWQE